MPSASEPGRRPNGTPRFYHSSCKNAAVFLSSQFFSTAMNDRAACRMVIRAAFPVHARQSEGIPQDMFTYGWRRHIPDRLKTGVRRT